MASQPGYPPQPVDPPQKENFLSSAILQILSQKELHIEKIVKKPHSRDLFSDRFMGSTCCHLCFWNPLVLLFCLCEFTCDTEETRDPIELLVEDDLLMVKTYIKNPKESEQKKKNLKFYRTVQKSYNQAITFTWTITHSSTNSQGAQTWSGTETKHFDIMTSLRMLINYFSCLNIHLTRAI